MKLLLQSNYNYNKDFNENSTQVIPESKRTFVPKHSNHFSDIMFTMGPINRYVDRNADVKMASKGKNI